ncbi:MAG: zinc-ribbon domain-containing protein [Bacteroidota bacterium]
MVMLTVFREVADFFLIIIGARPVVRRGEGTIRRHCPRCGDLRNFTSVTWRNWLTFFFLPVLPLGAERHGYACASCDLMMDSSTAAAEPAGETPAPLQRQAGESLILQCPRCDGRMRVPLRERGFIAVCPHCAKEFRVKSQREPVPEAEVREG